jgi:hypothetical protein
MTNHALLDQVIDSLLAEQGLSPETRAALDAKPQQEHWLRRSMKTGPVQQLPSPSRR